MCKCPLYANLGVYNCDWPSLHAIEPPFAYLMWYLLLHVLMWLFVLSLFPTTLSFILAFIPMYCLSILTSPQLWPPYFFFFYQQWINKIKGDTSRVSQPIYINQKWTSNVIHTRNSPLWLEQNNLKERKPIPKKPTGYPTPNSPTFTSPQDELHMHVTELRRPPTT